jgi:lipopolysaccharide/colanic/teichoic acid biosynthesis glycosyltransferase
MPGFSKRRSRKNTVAAGEVNHFQSIAGAHSPQHPVNVIVEQFKKLVPFYSLRHHLPPGITGWAQVNYPYGASVEDAKRKLQYDLFYVRYASLTMDLRILLRTIRVILFRRGSR